MKINHKIRVQLWMQNSFFVVLFLALISLLAYVSHEYHFSKDITQSNRNVLSEASVNVLKQMHGPVNIKVFASADNTSGGEQYRKGLVDFISRFKRAKTDIMIEFISPAEQPKIVQEEGVTKEGELVVEYQKRSEHLVPPYSEHELTNLLVRLSRTHEQPIMYLDGHDERNLRGTRPNDLNSFGQHLEDKGFKLVNPDLVTGKDVPANGAMLVIASPQKDLSAIEAKKIKAYLDGGGNLLWLLDDNNYHGLKDIAEYLGLQVSSGVVIDKSLIKYGGDPKNVFASQYGEHAITKKMMYRTMFHEARQVSAQGNDENGWTVSNLVDVAAGGWLETNKTELAGDISKVNYNAAEDKPGPINIAVALERKYGKKGQRVVVIGNSSFLSDIFVTSESNRELGVNVMNWLAGDESLIVIQPKPLKDMSMKIPDHGWGQFVALMLWIPIFGIPFGLFSGLIPLVLVVIGLRSWIKRRKA
jgi:hypothetical protein